MRGRARRFRKSMRTDVCSFFFKASKRSIVWMPFSKGARDLRANGLDDYTKFHNASERERENSD